MEQVRSCWDFWQCPAEMKENCRVFKLGLGDSCWQGDSYMPKAKRDFQFCSQCAWYQTING